MEKNEKNRLFLDASERSFTAVLKSGQKIAYEFNDEPKSTLENMFPIIVSLCKKCGIKYSDIDEMYMTTGPGSITGIRMVLAQARVFFALKKEADLYAIPTLDLVFGLSHEKSGLAILSDRHNTLFYALYKNGEKVGEGHANSIEEIECFKNEPIIHATCDKNAKLLTEGKNALEVNLINSLSFLEGFRKYTPDNVSELVPLYTEKI